MLYFNTNVGATLIRTRDGLRPALIFHRFRITIHLLAQQPWEFGRSGEWGDLKLPISCGARTVTFAYIDPGYQTARELRSWGEAHGRLWDAVRGQGRQVRVVAIAGDHDTIATAWGIRSARIADLKSSANRPASRIPPLWLRRTPINSSGGLSVWSKPARSSRRRGPTGALMAGSTFMMKGAEARQSRSSFR